MSPSKHRPIGLYVAASLALGWTGNCSGFNEPGHLETTRLIVAKLPIKYYSEADKRVLIACSQLPDMARELDATNLYLQAFKNSPFQWAAWGVGNSLGTPELQRMFAAQQLLHALTGGDAGAMHDVALETVRRLAVLAENGEAGEARFEALCASGLSLHLLGDSLAHTQMQWDPAPTSSASRNGDGNPPWAAMKMYPTGRGHGLADQHFPDYIRCSYLTKGGWNGQVTCGQYGIDTNDHLRFDRWKDYWSFGYAALSKASATPSERAYADEAVEALVQRLTAKSPAPDGTRAGTPDKDDANMGIAIRSYVENGHPLDQNLDTFSDIASTPDLSVWKELPPCDKILLTIVSLYVEGMTWKQPPATCSTIWTRYSDSAIASFWAKICRGSSSLPVDKAWKDLYCASGGVENARIRHFADQVLPHK